MPVSGKVLVDTSVWIAFFRKSYHSTVIGLLSEDRVCSAGIIVAELMQGPKSGTELAILKDFIHTFEFLPESPPFGNRPVNFLIACDEKG
jgi:predicted nucleic acid-binding protein